MSNFVQLKFTEYFKQMSWLVFIRILLSFIIPAFYNKIGLEKFSNFQMKDRSVIEIECSVASDFFPLNHDASLLYFNKLNSASEV